MRTLIKNGLVYDGSGGTPFRKDVLIKDGFIEAVTESAEAAAAEVIDAVGACRDAGLYRYPQTL